MSKQNRQSEVAIREIWRGRRISARFSRVKIFSMGLHGESFSKLVRNQLDERLISEQFGNNAKSWQRTNWTFTSWFLRRNCYFHLEILQILDDLQLQFQSFDTLPVHMKTLRLKINNSFRSSVQGTTFDSEKSFLGSNCNTEKGSVQQRAAKQHETAKPTANTDVDSIKDLFEDIHNKELCMSSNSRCFIKRLQSRPLNWSIKDHLEVRGFQWKRQSRGTSSVNSSPSVWIYDKRYCQHYKSCCGTNRTGVENRNSLTATVFPEPWSGRIVPVFGSPRYNWSGTCIRSMHETASQKLTSVQLKSCLRVEETITWHKFCEQLVKCVEVRRTSLLTSSYKSRCATNRSWNEKFLNVHRIPRVLPPQNCSLRYNLNDKRFRLMIALKTSSPREIALQLTADDAGRVKRLQI